MANPGTNYVVSVKLTADDKEVRDAIAHLTSMAQGQAAESSKKAVSSVQMLTDSFKQIGQSMSGFRHQMRALTQTYQTVRNVVGFGFRDALTGAITINQDLENIEMGMSAVLTSVDRVSGGPFSRLADSQKEINRLMGVMRDEAKQTPAEFDGIAQAFMVMLPSTRELVGNLDEVAKLAANASTWDKLAGVGTGTTARDFKQILTGHMSMREIQNPMLAKKLLDLKAVFAEARKLEEAGDLAGNKIKMREMLQLMTKLTELDTDVKSMMENSFTGQKEALVNQLKLLVQEGTKPLWEELKNTLRELNAWASTPQGAAKIREFAKDAGEFLKDAALFLKGVFQFFYDHWGAVKAVFITFMAVWGTSNVLSFVGGLAKFVIALRSATMGDLIRALLGFSDKTKTGAVGAAGVGATAVRGAVGTGEVAKGPGWKGTTAGNVTGAAALAVVTLGLSSALSDYADKSDFVASEDTRKLRNLAKTMGYDPKMVPEKKGENFFEAYGIAGGLINQEFDKMYKKLTDEAVLRRAPDVLAEARDKIEMVLTLRNLTDTEASVTSSNIDVKVGKSTVGTGGTP